MELLFVYIDSYRTHQRLGINFDANYRFELNQEVLSLERKEVLPRRFFAFKNSQKGVPPVENVSAIIGPNGSGKTSIVSFLDEILSGGESCEDIRFLYVVQESTNAGGRPRFICRHNISSNLNDNQPNEILETQWCSEYVPYGERIRPINAALVYYSPFFNTQRVLKEGTKFIDISTARYLRMAFNLKEYEQGERDRLLSLIRKIGKKRTSFVKGMPFPAPNNINIRITDRSYVRAGNALVDNSRSRFSALYHARDPLIQLSCHYARRIPDSNVNYTNFIVSKLVEASNAVDEMSIANGYERESEKPFYTWKSLNPNERDAIKKRLIKGLSAYTIDLDEDPQIHGYYETHAAFVALLNDLYELSERSQTYNEYEISVKIRSSKQQELLYKILGSVDTIETGFYADYFQDLVSIELGQMSTGEMAYLTLMARLCDNLETSEHKDVLLFLDEAETTLHPGWQKQLVYNIIWYFEHFATRLRVHVIFASHSPMLLSDMPFENVTILGTKKDHASDVKTFGANVFDLYRASFGMDTGVFGMIARKKLDALLDKIGKRVPLDKDDVLVSRLFGNRLIADYLNSAIDQ